MENKQLCPICGEGHVISHVDQVESEHKGHKAMVALHYKVCDTCTSDFAGAEESRLSKRAVMAFRKSVDGLLNGAEILALRKQYHLTQDQAAKLFGGGPVAFSKYENDDVSQSESMDSLLRLVRRSEVAFWELVEEKGMSAELKPFRKAESVAKTVMVDVRTTNVVAMADFRNTGFRTSSKSSFTYPTEPSKWK